MEILYRSERLKTVCSKKDLMIRRLGERNARRLMQRLTELADADCLEDMRYYPAAQCHELKADRQGQLAVDLVHPQRLVFAPDHDPAPRKSDGGLDWGKVKRICILEIVDYH